MPWTWPKQNAAANGLTIRVILAGRCERMVRPTTVAELGR